MLFLLDYTGRPMESPQTLATSSELTPCIIAVPLDIGTLLARIYFVRQGGTVPLRSDKSELATLPGRRNMRILQLTTTQLSGIKTVNKVPMSSGTAIKANV